MHAQAPDPSRGKGSRLAVEQDGALEHDHAVDIVGADALAPEGRAPSSVFGPDDVGAPNSSMSWVGTLQNARSGTIYAGSSEVQRNILGEMVLGLPKEPRPN